MAQFSVKIMRLTGSLLGENQQPEPRSPNSRRFGRLALAVASVAGILLCALIAWPFLGAITWALTLAILFAPLHGRVEKFVRQARSRATKYCGHRNTSAVPCGDDGAEITAEAAQKRKCTASNSWVNASWRGTSTDRSLSSRFVLPC